jgi:DNA adenine methylase
VDLCSGGCVVPLARDPDDRRLWVGKNKGVSELINDTNGRLQNFWRVLRCGETFEVFRRQAEAIPMGRPFWEEAVRLALEPDDLDVDDAVNFFVQCRQSRSGQMNGFTPITRTRTRRRMNGNVSEWLGSVEGLPAVHERIGRWLIECTDAINLIKSEDSEHTLFYFDPPYLGAKTAKLYGEEHTPSPEWHARALEALDSIRGKAIISGYHGELYDRRLAGWRLKEAKIKNNLAAGQSKKVETECIWMNY